MKNKFLLCSLFLTTYSYTEVPTVPSVADVFGGMSEEEITKQVQLGQQFLEDLEKYGSPEEKAQFEQLLVETLNSMSEADFNDIQQIAKMVEPNLEFPKAESIAPTTASPVSAKEEKPVAAIVTDEVEIFKTLISTIIQRIDDILQKLNSSKECAQEIDARWTSKATFNNMKRQIYQLRNTRLAQKLAKSNLPAEDKALVDKLNAFLKSLTEQNDTLVIEDDFGLPSSREVEQKHLKKTKAILSMFDDYIDTLMPMLEKFLVKWDPEALQLAKEAEEKTTKALKNAADATTRRASPDARPSAQQSPYGAQQGLSRGSGTSGSEYQDFGAGYPNYYDQAKTQDAQMPSSLAQSQPGMAGKAQPTTTTDTAKSKNKGNLFEGIVDDLDSHIEQFGQKQIDLFTNFLSNDVEKNYDTVIKKIANYPFTSRQQPGQEQNIPLQKQEASDWLTTVFDKYTTDAMTDLKNYTDAITSQLNANGAIQKEFNSIADVVNNATQAIRDISTDESNKTASLSQIATIKQRMTDYKNALAKTKAILNASYEKIKTALGTSEAPGTVFKERNDMIEDEDMQKKYKIAHNQFMRDYQVAHTNILSHLKSDLEDKIDSTIAILDNLQRRARKQSTRKSAASTAVSTAING